MPRGWLTHDSGGQQEASYNTLAANYITTVPQDCKTTGIQDYMMQQVCLTAWWPQGAGGFVVEIQTLPSQ